MSDLIERLNQASNKNAHTSIGVLWNLCDEAADEIERFRSLLTRAHQSVCSLECPATWKTADGQTHCDLCREITEALR